MNKNLYFIISLVFAFLFTIVVVYSINEIKIRNDKFTFRCYGPTNYELEDASIKVNQSLRISGQSSGYFVLDGYLSPHSGQPRKLHRAIKLDGERKVFRNTYEFQVSEIHKSLNDQLSEAEFNSLLMEFTSDSKRIAFDIIHVSDTLYLVGTPESYMFTCNSY